MELLPPPQVLALARVFEFGNAYRMCLHFNASLEPVWIQALGAPWQHPLQYTFLGCIDRHLRFSLLRFCWLRHIRHVICIHIRIIQKRPHCIRDSQPWMLSRIDFTMLSRTAYVYAGVSYYQNVTTATQKKECMIHPSLKGKQRLQLSMYPCISVQTFPPQRNK